MGQELRVGFGTADITPTPKTGEFVVYDPIEIRALILEQDGVTVAILGGDLFSMETDLVDAAMSRLTDVSSVSDAVVLPCASHIGTAPVLYRNYVTQRNPALRWFDREDYFIDGMVEALRRASEKMEPARVGLGRASAPGVLFNRRSYDAAGQLVMSNFRFPYPRPELAYGPVDDTVYVLRVDDHEGTPRKAAFAFGCHALCSTDRYGNISADYPGVARTVLGAAGIESLFMPGSIGNAVPVSRGGRTAARVGHSVAGAALYALEQIDTEQQTADVVPLHVKTIELEVPVFGDSPDPEKSTDGLDRFRSYAKRLRGAGRTHFPYRITRVDLPGGRIVHLPGEVFVETAAAIRAAASGGVTMVVSGPSADVGYLSTPEAHREGGMEPQYAGLAAEAEATIRAAACDLVAAAPAWAERPAVAPEPD